MNGHRVNGRDQPGVASSLGHLVNSAPVTSQGQVTRGRRVCQAEPSLGVRGLGHISLCEAGGWRAAGAESWQHATATADLMVHSGRDRACTALSVGSPKAWGCLNLLPTQGQPCCQEYKDTESW